MNKEYKIKLNSLYGTAPKLDIVSEYPSIYTDTDSVVSEQILNDIDFVKFPKNIGAEMLDREYRTLHCYVIPHSSVGDWIADKYKSGFEVDLDFGEDFKTCDFDGILAALGVVSYTEYEGDPYLTGYGIELMKQGLVWLEPDWDNYMRKLYNI